MGKSSDGCSSCRNRRECLRGCSARTCAGGDGIFLLRLVAGQRGFVWETERRREMTGQVDPAGASPLYKVIDDLFRKSSGWHLTLAKWIFKKPKKNHIILKLLPNIKKTPSPHQMHAKDQALCLLISLSHFSTVLVRSGKSFTVLPQESLGNSDTYLTLLDTSNSSSPPLHRYRWRRGRDAHDQGSARRPH